MGIVSAILALFTSVKGLLTFLFITVIGIILYNLAVELLVEFLNFGLAKVADVTGSIDGSLSPTYQFTGLAGYLATHLMIPQCIAIMVSFVSLRFLLGFIPFFNFK